MWTVEGTFHHDLAKDMACANKLRNMPDTEIKKRGVTMTVTPR